MVNLATSFERNGAAIGARRHHEALRTAGLESIGFLYGGGGEREGVRSYDGSGDPLAMKWMARLRWEWLKRSRAHGFRRRSLTTHEGFVDDRTHFGPSLLRALPDAAIYHLHGVDGFVDIAGFFRRVGGRRPIFWTLHDMSPLTGGCSVNYDCTGFLHGCGRCPQLGGAADDASARIWRRRQKALSPLVQADLCYIATSSLMAEQAAQSPLANRFRIEQIPLPIDIERFSPHDRSACKAALGLPAGRIAIGFVSSALRRVNKGLERLLGAISSLSGEERERIVLLLVGRSRNEIETPCDKRLFGEVQDEEEMVSIYNAADLLVAPSRQESFGQTVLEAMACGTPCIGSDIGGIRDQIRHGEDGWLFPLENEGGLAGWIRKALDDQRGLAEMGARARASVVSRNGYAVVGERFARLYADALERFEAAHA